MCRQRYKPVPDEEEHRRRQDVEREIDRDLRDDERRPMVHGTMLLANLKDVAEVNERDLKLVGERE